VSHVIEQIKSGTTRSVFTQPPLDALFAHNNYTIFYLDSSLSDYQISAYTRLQMLLSI